MTARVLDWLTVSVDPLLAIAALPAVTWPPTGSGSASALVLASAIDRARMLAETCERYRE